MNILFVFSRAEFASEFDNVLMGLMAQRHEIRLAFLSDKGTATPGSLAAGHKAVMPVVCPAGRQDEWTEPAHLLRCLRDYSFYLDPRFTAASKLRLRTLRLLVRAATHGAKTQASSDCPVCGADLSGDHWAWILRECGSEVRAGLDGLMSLTELAIPSDRTIVRFIESQCPDVLVVAPLARLGTRLVDYVKAAQTLGIPVAAPVMSFEELSAEGSLHVIPDRLLVWNEFQQTEARTLHGVPADRVVVTGAPRFDDFSSRRPATDRRAFCEVLRLDPDRPIVVFLGSSEFVASNEPAFVERWATTIRRNGDETLRSCNIVLRPHPKNVGAYQRLSLAPDLAVVVSGPDDEQGLFDCLAHGSAAVGLNTGAFVEAALLGKPTLTVLVPECAGAQQNTLHFHYLLRRNGGFVEVADTLDVHMGQLASALCSTTAGNCGLEFAERFVGGGVGRAKAVAATVDAIERLGKSGARRGLFRWSGRTLPADTNVGSVLPARIDIDGLPIVGSDPLGRDRVAGVAVCGPTPERQAAPLQLPESLQNAQTLLETTDLSALGTDPTISEFWKRQISNALDQARVDVGGHGLRLVDVVTRLGFEFEPLPAGLQIDEDPCLLEVLAAWRQMRPLLRRSGSKFPGFDLKRWEHLSAIAWLEDQNLVDDYLAFIRPFHIRSDMSTVRHFYRMRVIERLCADHLKRKGLTMLEVGAGAGNLGVFLLSTGQASNYVIVDLPEMLLNAAVHVTRHCAGVEVLYDQLPDAIPQNAAPRLFLVRTTRIAELPNDQFDVMLNFNSFMEMDEKTRDLYIGQMYRIGHQGSLMYNVNRRQPKLPQPDGSFFDNSPLFYPYDPSDRIVFWEDDPFETAVRAWFGKRPSFSLARAALVTKSRSI